MKTNASPHQESSGYEKPARIVYETPDGTKTIDAEHHVRSNHGWVSVYTDDTSDGIDVQIPRERVVEIRRGREHHDDEDEQRLTADGGIEIPECTCGEDLTETAELDTHYAPRAGARPRNPAVREVPGARCGECGEDAGQFGTEVVVALWEARGESLPGHGESEFEGVEDPSAAPDTVMMNGSTPPAFDGDDEVSDR